MLEHESGASALRFALLGPVRVWRGAAEITVASGHRRLLLALLLARAGRLAETPEIARLLWYGEDAPRTAVNMVHRYVGQLRRTLEPDLMSRAGGRWLLTDAAGYRLAVSAQSLDLLEFRAQVARGRHAAAAGDDAAALDRYLAGLALWKGRCGAGLGTVVEVHPDFMAIEREFTAATREAARTALRCGEVGRVLPVLREAAVRNPLDEIVHARLLQVLAADGNQAEAVALYGEHRTRLADELGMSPGPELQAAFRAVLRGDSLPTGPAPAALPRQRLRQPAVVSSRPVRPAPAAIAVRPAQLPSDLRLFVGRTGCLSEGAALLRSERSSMPVLAYDGMPGVGKTALVLRLAHRMADEFPDGQLYLDLHGFDASPRAADPSDLLRSILSTLGVPRDALPPSLDARAALYRSVLANRRMLVVLDNARETGQVRPLLPGTAGNAVLITSRGRLTGLAMANGAHLRSLEVPTQAEARECLRARLGARRAEAEPATLDDIIKRCGRLPLALAIVAARATADADRSLGSIAAELRGSSGTLDAFRDDRIDDDLRSVFTWSYQALSAAAARMLRLLATQPEGDVSAESAAASAGIPPAPAREQLAELVRTGLINRHGPRHYGLHDLVRTYAVEGDRSASSRRCSAVPQDRQRCGHSAGPGGRAA